MHLSLLWTSAKALFGVWSDDEEANESYLPPTLSETLSDLEQGVSYLLGLLADHGHDTTTLEANLQAAITDLLKRVDAGESQSKVLTQVVDAVESVVKLLLASPPVSVENAETGSEAGVNPAIVPVVSPQADVTLPPSASGTSSADLSQSATPATNSYLVSPRTSLPPTDPPESSADSAAPDSQG